MQISHLCEDSEPAGGESCENGNPNTLVQRDLVTLYQNVDTKQTSTGHKKPLRPPNQYVETVVYNDDQESEGSDSEIYSNEDFYDVVLINKERIDLINNFPSVDNTLCQKIGDIAIRPDRGTGCTDSILFKNRSLKERFNSLNGLLNFGTFDGAFFSTSLLDFVCCNNLEDNSNLYMDNIIQYARRTIEQLKRISNGDYLTEKAKEKWKTLGNEYKDRKENEIVKVASSNPLRIECDVNAFNNRWRDFIHSELDIRSLTKILEKRIIKIPRFIYGSFTFLDKRCENNLVISCQKESDQAASGDGSESQIDIVVQLKTSKTDNLAREIESVLVIRNSLPSIKDESWLPLEFKSLNSETNINDNVQNQITLTEFNESSEDREVHTFAKEEENSTEFAFQCVSSSDTKSSELSLCEFSSLFTMATNDGTSNFSSDKQYNHGEQVTIETQISCFRAQDDLFTSLQKLGTQTVVLEENEEASLTKKKSPTKVRIKSPYENKSHALEEKKRRKLLEIRERREKKKKSLSENCKVTKHKHGKGAVMAQSSNSVTKLSITNKSFYTSIYGDKMKVTNNHSVKHSHIELSDKDDDLDEDSIKDVTILKKENRVNYNYYLDETETEMMNLKLKQKQKYQTTKPCKRPPSMLSNSTTNFDSFAGASCNSSTSDLKPKSDSYDGGKRARSCFSEMIQNTPLENTNASYSKKSLTSVECKKSIDKIYELMRKLSKVDSSESVYSKHKVTPATTSHNNTAMDKKATAITTDSCASIKCQLTSSNPSIFSFEGKNNEILYSDGKGKSGLEANSITKVIISSKPHVRTEKNETKPHKKVRIHSPENITKNPLKAISHLINEFDNIQKGKNRGALEPRDYRKTNSFVENKILPRFNLLKKVPRNDNENKDGKLIPNKNISNNETKNQYRYPMVRGKVMNEPVGNVNKVVEREKKVLDIVDEAIREARGEAVKGPSRQFTRLDSLAQPKKSYVNAQAEAMKLRYGRNYSSGAPPQGPDKTRPIRQRRNEQDVINVTTSKTANNIPPKVADKYKRVRRPNNVPIENVVPQVNALNYRQRTVPEAPRTSKKMIPVESNPKKRPFTLSSSLTSSNLLQKSPVSNDFPPFHVLQNNRTPISNAATTPSFEKDPVENKARFDSSQNEASVSLSVINESKTSLSCNEKRNNFFSTLSSNDELISICSDYIIDVFEDKNILTAVSNILPKNAKVKDIDKENNNGIQTIYSDTNIPHNGIVGRIDSLEKALYDQISQGTFPKRLKIKKLTLTPKQSTNQVLLLQCGDANSIIKKSCMSQNLHFGRNKSITSLINMPLLSDSFQDQCYPRLPVNFTTVGYVFSNSKSIEMKSIENSSTTSNRCMGIQTHFRSNNYNLLPSEYSNDEKAVQTNRLNDDIICNNFNKMCKTEKVDKSTHLSKSLLNLNKTRENDNGIMKKENIENTTSLDILVELLDEIEKITKYQNLKASEKQNKESNEPYKLFSKPHEHKPVKQYCDTISVDVKRKIPKQCNNTKIRCVDKEVAVNITKEYVNEFTETPNSVPVTNYDKIETNSLTVNVTNINNECIGLVTNAESQMSTNKSVYENAPNSLTGIVSQPSSQSLISLYDYRAYCLRKFKVTPIHNYDGCNKFLEYKALEKNDSKDLGKYKIIRLKTTPQTQKGVSISNQNDFDNTLKMKRDILVTVYSILVFTVFAALSFPEFIYRS